MSQIHDLFGELRSLLQNHTPNPTTRKQLYDLLVHAREQDDSYETQWRPYLKDFQAWLEVPLTAVTLDCRQGDYLDLLPSEQVYSVLVGSDCQYSEFSLKYRLHDCFGIRFEKWSWADSENFSGPEITADAAMLASFINQLNIPELRQLEIVLDQTVDYYDEFMTDWSKRKVAFTSYSLKSLAKAPILDQIRFFGISNNLNTRQLEILTEHPFWNELQELDLSHNALPKAAMRKLFPEGFMPKLRCLSLRGNKALDETTVNDLLRSSRFPSLTYLDLRDCSVTENAAQRLVGSTYLPHLKSVLV